MSLPITSTHVTQTTLPVLPTEEVKSSITLIALAALEILSSFVKKHLPCLTTLNLSVILVAATCITLLMLRAFRKSPPKYNHPKLDAHVKEVFDYLTANKINFSPEKKLTLTDIPGLESLVETIEEDLQAEKKLRRNLRSGSEAYVESVLDKYVPDTASKEKLLDRLELVLKQEYITAQLRDTNKLIQADSHEQIILEHLNYNTTKYRDKNILLKLIEIAINDHYKELTDSDTIRALKEKMNEVGQVCRLKAANVDHQHIPRVQSLIQTTRKMKEEALVEITKRTPTENYCQDITHRLNKKMIEHSLEGDRKYFANYLLNSYFRHQSQMSEKIKTNSDEVWNITLSTFKADFLTKFPRQVTANNIGKYTEETNARVAFFKKWDAHLITNIVQGWEDGDETLGRGVCYANCVRLCSREQDQTDIKELDNSPYEITAADRVNQSLYHFRVNEANMHLSSSSSKKESDVENPILNLKNHILNDVLKKVDPKKTGRFLKAFRVDPSNMDSSSNCEHLAMLIPTLKQDFIENAEKINDSKGVVLFSLSLGKIGHATYIKLDQDNQIFRFYDPNFGRVKLANQTELMDFIHDLLKNFYPEINGYTLMQMIPKQNSQ